MVASTLALFAPRSSSGSAAGLGVFFVVFAVLMAINVAIYVFYSYCLGRVFQRAGLTTWWAWVPFVNSYGLWKMTSRDQTWLILLFIPYANIVALVVIMIDVARSFGKSEAFGWGLGLLGIVFIPMLAFDDSPFLGPAPPKGMPWGTTAAGGWGQPASPAPGTYPPGPYPPAAYPPGPYPPAAYPPGAYPPAAYPPGTYPPAADPSSGEQPPAWPPAAAPVDPGAGPPA